MLRTKQRNVVQTVIWPSGLDPPPPPPPPDKIPGSAQAVWWEVSVLISHFLLLPGSIPFALRHCGISPANKTYLKWNIWEYSRWIKEHMKFKQNVCFQYVGDVRYPNDTKTVYHYFTCAQSFESCPVWISGDMEKVFSLAYFHKRNVTDTGINFSTDCIIIGTATDLATLPCPTRQKGTYKYFDQVINGVWWWRIIFCWDRWADFWLMMICMKALRTCCISASSVGGRHLFLLICNILLSERS